MPTFYGAIDLAKNELRNAVVQNLGAAPGSPIKGQIYFDSTANILYWWNGTVWVAAQSGSSLPPATTVTTQAVGDSAVVGVSTNYAREDHKHGREGFGAVTAQTAFGAASNNGAAITVARSDHVHGTPTHDAAAHSTIPLSALGVPTGPVNMNGQVINNVGTPVLSTDAANKGYVDNLVAGLSWKESVRAASTANMGTINGNTLDGVTLVTGERVLLKNQTTTSQNGIYQVITGGSTWTRTLDADAVGELEGAAVFVQEGTTNADTAWVCISDGPITPGTTANLWSQFAGGGTVTAGAGMTQSGNTLNVIAGDTSLTVAADSVIVNTAVIATVASVTGKAGKYAGALVGTTSPETVTHNLNTRDIQLTVLNGSTPYTAVEVDWDATTVNTAVIRFNPALGAGYRVVVTG